MRKNPRGGTFMGKTKTRRGETGNRSRRGAKQRGEIQREESKMYGGKEGKGEL